MPFMVMACALEFRPNEAYNRYWMQMTHHDVPAHFGLRTREYKIIFFYGLPLDATDALPIVTPPGWELYDLVNDPFENRNVYDDPAYAEMKAEAREALYRVRAELGEDDSKYPELVSLLETTG